MSKRILAFLISALMLLSVCPFGAFAADWDGTAASSFSGGSGSKEDPYELSTAGDIALLIYDLDMGNTDYSGVYFEITNDIRMNNETCEFVSDSGLIKVSDGKNTAFIGTGIKGDASGDNALFDETASKANYWYASDESIDCVHHYDRETIYSGELYFLHSSYSNGRKDFKGVLDGKNHTVSGAFGYDSGDSAYAEYNGFFMEAVGASIKNLTIADSLFFGSTSGGFAGYAEDSMFNNCVFDGIVIGIGGIVGKAVNSDFGECINMGYILGNGNTGGIVGVNEAEDDLNYIAYCDNEGTVIYQGEYSATGGVIGYNSNATVEYCENKGNVYGGDYFTGGVVGNCYSATVSRCINRGVVSGGSFDIGGVVGMASDDSYNEGVEIINCTNYGKVFGTGMDVGGVVGFFDIMIKGSLDGCYNFGLVSSEKYIGGIIGSLRSRGDTNVKNCKNEGYLDAKGVIGGIIGSLSSTKGNAVVVSCCKNNIAISATEGNNVGGIVGNLSGWESGVLIERCYNSGDLSATAAAGGIVGFCVTKTLYGETGAETDMIIENCYNSGNIKTNEKAGGLVGYVQSDSGSGRPLNIKNSYNAGKVEAVVKNGGRLLGSCDYVQINITDCYFLADENMSNSCGSVSKLNDNSKELTESEMTVAESFAAFDFEDIWEIGKYTNYDYPTIIGLSHELHSHSMKQEKDSKYHWDECKCGYAENKEEHTEILNDRGDGFSEIVCDVCGEFLGIVENEHDDIMLGDVNDDGAINQYDYILVKRHYFGTRYLSDDELTRADVNSDGNVNQYDYILIKRHYFGTYVIG